MKKLGMAFTVFTSMILLCATTASAALYSDWDPYEQQVFELVNLQRSHHGLTALAADSRLQTAADLHSEDMALNDFFSHTGSDGSTPSTRVSAQAYDWNGVAENIAAGYTSAHSVMYGTDNLQLLSDFDMQLGHDGFSDWDEVGQDWTGSNWDAWADEYGGGWMGSTGHRENILDYRLTDLGVGYYYLGSDTGDINYFHYWTQDFAWGDTAEDPSPSPVPIPASLLLFGTGMFSLLGFRRYKQ